MPALLSLVPLVALAASGPRIAMPGFSAVNSDPKVAAFFAEYLGQQLVAQGPVTVTTPDEVAAILGFERQKALLGCTESSASCTAEMAGALGVDALIIGSVGKFGAEHVLTVKLLSAKTGQLLSSRSIRAKQESEVFDELNKTARQFAEVLGIGRSAGATSPAATAGGTAPSPSTGAPASSPRGFPFGMVGGAALVGVGALGLSVGGLEAALWSESRNLQVAAPDAGKSAYDAEIGRYQTRMIVGLASGVVAAGAGLWLMLSDGGGGAAARHAYVVPVVGPSGEGGFVLGSSW